MIVAHTLHLDRASLAVQRLQHATWIRYQIIILFIEVLPKRLQHCLWCLYIIRSFFYFGTFLLHGIFQMQLRVPLYLTFNIFYCIYSLIIYSICSWAYCIYIEFGFCLGQACKEAEYASVVIVVDLIN